MPSPLTIIGNDEFYQVSELPPGASGRAFRYGDGLFETILVRNGRAWQLARHLDRMLDGMEVLGFEFDAGKWRTTMREVTARLAAQIHRQSFGRLRIQVYRSGGGAYLPETDRPEFIAGITPLDQDPWESGKEWHIGIYHEVPVSFSVLSTVKSTNSLPYILGARHARSRGWDDALLRSTDGSLAEGTCANLFLVRSASLLTPPLKSGCLPGIMRGVVMETGGQMKLQVMERSVSTHDLEAADEIFLCNVIRGLVPVGRLDGLDWRPAGDRMRSRLMARIREEAV